MHGLLQAYLLVGSVEGVGIVGLRTDHAGHLVDQAHVHAHLEALVEGIDVPQVASGNDHPVGHFPVKLLADLNGSSLLALQSQTAASITDVSKSCSVDTKDVNVAMSDASPAREALCEVQTSASLTLPCNPINTHY